MEKKSKYPATPDPKGLRKFLEFIIKSPAPPKVSGEYLKHNGFKKANDSYIPSILKQIGFIDSHSVPTERYVAHRNHIKTASNMFEAIKKVYPEIFSVYPDPRGISASHIKGRFKELLPQATDNTLTRTVAAFRELLSFCGSPEEAVDESGDIAKEVVKDTQIEEMPADLAPQKISWKIEINLPATSNIEVYDAIFSSLRKHFNV